jgi:crotonobetainyl-CoA:carnitine CoA-transferase CaiB-like acyl-CoA transferase
MIAPSDIYRTSGGRWIALAPTGDAFWQALCAAIGQPGLAADARYATPAARVANVESLTEELAGAIGRRTAQEWLDIFEARRVPAALVLGVDEALAHPLAASRGMVESVARPQGGEPVRMLGNPFKFAGQPQLGYPPALGQDTEALLRRMAGYGDDNLAALRAAGVIRTGGAVAGAAR